MNLQIKLLTADAIVPVKAHVTDSGFDLFAAEDVIIEPGETAIVKTGVAIALPSGHEAQIRGRSGITAKTKLRVQLGTIDESYRGELGIIVDNIAHEGPHLTRGLWTITDELCEVETVRNNHSYVIRKGDKFAQLVIVPVAHPTITVVDELNSGERGENGFGSTGVRMEGKY